MILLIPVTVRYPRWSAACAERLRAVQSLPHGLAEVLRVLAAQTVSGAGFKSRPHASQARQGRARGDDERPCLYGGPMASVKQFQVTFDCAEPERVARFWCEVLGYVVPPPPAGFATWDDFDRALPPERQGSAFACIDPSGVGPRLFFQRVPEGKVVKNRLHLDVRVGTGLVGEERLAALEAECARLVALGAVRVRLLLADGVNESCLVMQDIEGNEFCLD
jgi:Glyoxalase-like domain